MIRLFIMIIKSLILGPKLNNSAKRNIILPHKTISYKKTYRKILVFISNRHLSLIHKYLNYKIVFFNNKIKYKCIFNKSNNKIKIFAYCSKI